MVYRERVFQKVFRAVASAEKNAKKRCYWILAGLAALILDIGAEGSADIGYWPIVRDPKSGIRGQYAVGMK